jgi:chaperone required for assembly of F1-ATPase
MSDSDNGDRSAQAGGGPRGPITDSLSKPHLKRFYATARIGDGPPYPVLLDGRPVKTPAKLPLRAPTAPLAMAIAAEWAAQGDSIDPMSMPVTKLVNTAIDAVAANAAAVAADIAAYAGNDLLCYRAEGPVELVATQARLWNPVIAWAREALGANFVVATGVMPVEQRQEAIAAIAAALQPHEPFRLTALHVLTTLTGSALLAVAVDRKRIGPAEAWTAAHVDEDYQIALWGEDYEALARRKARRAEFDAACQLLQALE